MSKSEILHKFVRIKKTKEPKTIRKSRGKFYSGNFPRDFFSPNFWIFEFFTAPLNSVFQMRILSYVVNKP